MAVLLALCAPAIARAATIYPNVIGDEGTGTSNCSTSNPPAPKTGSEECSLRQALAFAKSGDEVSLAAPAASGTYTLKEELSITGKEIAIVGGGGVIAGGKKSRLLKVAASAKLTLTDVTLEQGQASEGSAILNEGIVALSDDTLSGNEAPAGPGGAIENKSGAGLTVSASTISNNKAQEGGAIDSQGMLAIVNSTIAANTAATSGGGLLVSGAGTTTIASATIADNAAAAGEGGNVSFRNASVVIKDSLIAGGETGAHSDCLVEGAIESGGYNLTDGAGGGECALTAAGDREGVAGLALAPLAQNGGATATIALGAESAAIGAGNPAGCTDQSGQPLSTDQRGRARPRQCDVGAFQTPAADLGVSMSAPATSAPGVAFAYTVTVTNSGPATATGVTLTDKLPASATLVSTPGCSGTSTLTCSLGTLASGAQTSVAITVTQSQLGAASNAAIVTSAVRDPEAANNLASASTTIESAAVAVAVQTGPPNTPGGSTPTPPSAGNLIMAFKQKLAATLSAYFLCKVTSCSVTLTGKITVGKRSIPVQLKAVTVKENQKQRLAIKLSKKLRLELTKALAKHQKVTLTVAASVRYGAFSAKTRPLTSTLES
jgi:uncharacterized repeat protein (TIGR01451 family)